MFIYWGMFLILATGALLNEEESASRRRMMFVLLASIPTALMIGLRWEVGPDWQAYSDIFNYTKLYSMGEAITHADPGFALLLWSLHQVSAPFWTVNMICGAIFVAGLSAFCRRQPNPWLAFLIAFPYLVIVVAMSGTRQSVALGLLFFGLNAYESGRLVLFTLLVTLGAAFHGSVMLMVPICLFSYTRSNLQRALLLAAAAYIAFNFLGDTFATYAKRYSSVKIQSTGVLYRVLMNAFPSFILLAFRERFALTENQFRLYRNFAIVTFLLAGMLLVVPSSTAIDRVILFLFPLQLVVLSRVPYIFSENRRSSGQFVLALIMYAALIQAVFLNFGVAAAGYANYRSILS